MSWSGLESTKDEASSIQGAEEVLLKLESYLFVSHYEIHN